MTARSRLAVVGLGFMGTKWARALAAHPGADVAVVCDVQEDRARRVATDLGARASTDPVAALRTAGLDGAVIATPESDHAEPALAAIEAGLPTAVEKPLAHTIFEAERVCAAAEARGVPVLTGHVLRFESRYAAMKRAIDDGVVGTVQAVRSERIGVLGDQAVLQGRTSLALYYGVHEFDLARWYVGEIEEITALRSHGVVRAHGFDVEDAYSAILRFDTGAHGTMMLGWCLPDATAAFGLAGFTVIGDRGYLRVDQGATGLAAVGVDGPVALDATYAPDVHDRPAGAVGAQADHFVRVVAGEVAPACTARDGLESLRSSLAMEASAVTSRSTTPADAEIAARPDQPRHQ